MPLLEFREEGIYCPQAKIYIDPWKPVDRAYITHGHSDHARWGSRYYLAHRNSQDILRYRLGRINLQTVEYGEEIFHNGVKFSLHPAGHILGSSQIRVEHKGEVWVFTGDYKLEDDGLSTPFEPVKCHAFITESTFGLPVYRWPAQEEIFAQVNSWWRQNQSEGKVSILCGYALGKAQRALAAVDAGIGKIFAHGAIFPMTDCYRAAGLELPEIHRVDRTLPKENFRGSLVIAPPSAMGTPWMKKFSPFSLGYLSGWMMIRGAKKRMAIDRGFVLSDHVDWDDLNTAVKATGAEKIFVTHGYTSAYARWLREEYGLDAREAHTQYEGDEQAELEEKNSSEGNSEENFSREKGDTE